MFLPPLVSPGQYLAGLEHSKCLTNAPLQTDFHPSHGAQESRILEIRFTNVTTAVPRGGGQAALPPSSPSLAAETRCVNRPSEKVGMEAGAPFSPAGREVTRWG